SGSSDTKSPPPSKSGDTSDVGTPSASETERLIKASFDEFADAVDDEDFSTFYQKSSANFKASNTADQMKSTFGVFIEKKDRILPSLRDIQSKSASFTSAPSVTTENGIKVLVADGQFPSKPTSTTFETKYERENGDWKMVKFKVKMQ